MTTSPAEYLCDLTMKRWNDQGVRADNTTIIVIMIENPDDELDDEKHIPPTRRIYSPLLKLPSTGVRVGLKLRKLSPLKLSPLKLSPMKRSPRKPRPFGMTTPRQSPVLGCYDSEPNQNVLTTLTDNKSEINDIPSDVKNSDEPSPLMAQPKVSVNRCVGSQTPTAVSWTHRLRSTASSTSKASGSNDSDQENDATVNIRDILDSRTKAITESPVKITELRGQLGNVAAGLVSTLWPLDLGKSKSSNKDDNTLDTTKIATSCLTGLSMRNAQKGIKMRGVKKGRISKKSMLRKNVTAGVISYCRRVKRHVRSGYNTRAHVKATLTKSKS